MSPGRVSGRLGAGALPGSPGHGSPRLLSLWTSPSAPRMSLQHGSCVAQSEGPERGGETDRGRPRRKQSSLGLTWGDSPSRPCPPVVTARPGTAGWGVWAVPVPHLARQASRRSRLPRAQFTFSFNRDTSSQMFTPSHPCSAHCDVRRHRRGCDPPSTQGPPWRLGAPEEAASRQPAAPGPAPHLWASVEAWWRPGPSRTSPRHSTTGGPGDCISREGQAPGPCPVSEVWTAPCRDCWPLRDGGRTPGLVASRDLGVPVCLSSSGRFRRWPGAESVCYRRDWEDGAVQPAVHPGRSSGAGHAGGRGPRHHPGPPGKAAGPRGRDSEQERRDGVHCECRAPRACQHRGCFTLLP